MDWIGFQTSYYSVYNYNPIYKHIDRDWGRGLEKIEEKEVEKLASHFGCHNHLHIFDIRGLKLFSIIKHNL